MPAAVTKDTEPDEAVEACLDAEGEADDQAGRMVPHDKVVIWLKSWGTVHPLPRPCSKPD
jgi:predicted transcriptional regulator